MQLFFRYATVTITILSLLMVPLCAMAGGNDNHLTEYSTGEMAADCILVRPLGFVSMVAGFGLFIVSSPFSALGGNFGNAWDTLVTVPAKFTFTRPLGKFN